jgi:hypothetical protein
MAAADEEATASRHSYAWQEKYKLTAWFQTTMPGIQRHAWAGGAGALCKLILLARRCLVMPLESSRACSSTTFVSTRWNGYGESLPRFNGFAENNGCPSRARAAIAGRKTLAAAAARLSSSQVMPVPLTRSVRYRPMIT